ncbi:MAG: BACON domain-containing protein, partial [Prevotella sp.]|nr:BACON domain-containing protein [Prevotella sp.]
LLYAVKVSTGFPVGEEEQQHLLVLTKLITTMKKLLRLKAMLLLCALIAGSGSVWAEDVTTTYIFTNRDWNATCGDESANWTCNTRAGGFTAGQGTQITKSATGANATSPKSFTNVKKIVVTYCTNSKAGAGAIKVKVGSGTEQSFSVSAPSSNGTTLKTTDFTFSPTETGAVTLTVDCTTNSIYIYSIAITEEGTVSSDPSISAADVEIGFDATSGEISYTINNGVDGGVLTASSETSWISDVTVDAENTKVTFTTTENASATSREGIITLVYKDGDDELATKDVTVTQAKAVITTKYTLATAITPGKHYIFVGYKNGSPYALGTQNSNNRAAVSVTEKDGTISVSSDDSVYELLIRGDVTTGYYTIYDEVTGGYLYAACGSGTSNYMRTETDIDDDGNATWEMSVNNSGIASIKAINASISRPWMRYNGGSTLFSCYQNSDSQSDIYLFERDDDESTQTVSVEIDEACTDGKKYYGTYSCPFAFTAPSGVTVSEVAVVDGELLVDSYDAGAVVPANTGVMISAATAGAKTLTLAAGGTSVLGTDNSLRATGSGITASEMSAADSNSLFYRLTMHDGTKIGFWWGAENGAAFSIAANKAYLAVPEETAAREGFAFDFEETTGITSTAMQPSTGQYYDLQGRRIALPTKGLYIMNGKKIILK